MTGLGREFINEVKTTCLEALGDLGFEKRKGIGIWEIDDEFRGWIGLNTATRRGDGTMAVNPFVGVRYDPIHRLIAETKGRKYATVVPPTISTFLGNLTSAISVLGFEFVKGQRIEPVVHELVECVRSDGLPYIRRNSSLESLAGRILQDNVWEDGGEKYSAALYLLGEMDLLDRFIDERLEEGRSKRVSVERFEEFARNLKTLIQERSG